MPDSHEDSKELDSLPRFPSADPNEPPSTNIGKVEEVKAKENDAAELAADRPAHTEPTQENVQNLESQPYATSKVQEWAEDVNDGSNQSTWSASKDIQNEPQINGIASTSSHEEAPKPVISDASHGQSSQTSAPEAVTVNGSPEKASKSTPSAPQPAQVQPPHEPTALPTITSHLLRLATTKIWADWVVMVNVSEHQPLATYAHSLVLVRSPRIESLMQHAGNTGVVNLYPPREILPQALEAALRFLYSDNIVSEDYPFPKNVEAREARANALNYILSYWVAAIEFGLAPVAACALHLLDGFIGWDMAELIMKEADELRLSVLQMGEERNGNRDDYLGVVSRWKKTVLRFLSTHINPETFKAQPASSPSLVRSRFALLEESRLRHNPALASMVFGSMPSSADLSPSSPQSEILPVISSIEDRVASNVIFNIDFDDLEYLCDHLCQARGPAAEPLIRTIVSERESRRTKVISNRTVPNKQRIANSAAWDDAGFREYFEGGFIRRDRVGFLLPTKTK